MGADVLGDSLADGRYALILSADKIRDDHGHTLAGGDSTVCFHRFFGDHDGDGDVDTTDLAALRPCLGKHEGDAGYLACFDFDASRVIDSWDYAQLRLRLGRKL
jgi:hypothetical protein